MDRILCDGKNRLACFAIENKELAGFRRLEHHWNRPSSDTQVDESWRRRVVVVPEIMTNRLEVPHHLARVRLDRNNRIPVLIAPFSLATEIVDAWRARGDKNNFPNRIRSKDRPRICRTGAVGVGPDPCLGSRIRSAL